MERVYVGKGGRRCFAAGPSGDTLPVRSLRLVSYAEVWAWGHDPSNREIRLPFEFPVFSLGAKTHSMPLVAVLKTQRFKLPLPYAGCALSCPSGPSESCSPHSLNPSTSTKFDISLVLLYHETRSTFSLPRRSQWVLPSPSISEILVGARIQDSPSWSEESFVRHTYGEIPRRRAFTTSIPHQTSHR